MRLKTRFTEVKQIEGSDPKILFAGTVVEWKGEFGDSKGVVTLKVYAEDETEFEMYAQDLELGEVAPKLEQHIQVHGEIDPKLLEENAAEEIFNRINHIAKKQKDEAEADSDNKWMEYISALEADLDALEARFDEFLSGKSFKVEYDQEGGLYLRGVANPVSGQILKIGNTTISAKGINVDGDVTDKSYKIPAKDLRLGLKVKLDIGQKEPYTVTGLETGWASTVVVSYIDANGYSDRTTKDFDFLVTVV